MSTRRVLGRVAILGAALAAIASADPDYHPSWETVTTLAPAMTELTQEAPVLEGRLLLTIAGDELLEERLRWADEQDLGQRSGFALVDMALGLVAVESSAQGASVALELVPEETGVAIPPATLSMAAGAASSDVLGVMLDPGIASLDTCFEAPSICTLTWDLTLTLSEDSDPALLQWDVVAVVLGRGAESAQASAELLFEPLP